MHNETAEEGFMNYFFRERSLKFYRAIFIISVIFLALSSSFVISQELDSSVNIYENPNSEEEMQELLLKELAKEDESAVEILTSAIESRPEFTKIIVQTILGVAPPGTLPRIIGAGIEAAPDQTAAIIGAAVSTLPGQTDAIVQAGILAAPEQTGTVVIAAIDAAPTLAPVVVEAAVTVAPEEAVKIVTVAINTAPQQAPKIVGAAVSVVPDQATTIVPVAIESAPGFSSEIIQAAVDGVASTDDATEIENTEAVTTVTTTDQGSGGDTGNKEDTGRQPDNLITQPTTASSP